MSDSRVARAKELHRMAAAHAQDAEGAREKRDRLIRQVYAGGGWSYEQLGQRIGCSRELIAHIVRSNR